LDKFVGSELVGLQSHPGQVLADRALFRRPYPVFPIITGNKITTGVTDDGNVKFPDQAEYVFAESPFIGFRVSWLVNAAVDRPAKMLDKRPVDSLVYLAGRKFPVNGHFSLHVILLMYKAFPLNSRLLFINRSFETATV
jgi:hypothetical protein